VHVRRAKTRGSVEGRHAEDDANEKRNSGTRVRPASESRPLAQCLDDEAFDERRACDGAIALHRAKLEEEAVR